MEGSTLEVADTKSGGTQRKWCITLKLGPQFGAKCVIHVLSAPSKQALVIALLCHSVCWMLEIGYLRYLVNIWRVSLVHFHVREPNFIFLLYVTCS